SYSSYSSLLFSSIRPPPISTLFPYTTLFRSRTVLILRFLLISPARSPGVCSCLLRRPVQPRRRRRATGLQGSGGHGLSVFPVTRSEEHTSELQSRENLVCRLLLEKKKKKTHT